MIPRSVKAPTIPIPFHKLLKVVAVVDRDNPQTAALLDQIRAEGYEVEVCDHFDRDLAEDASVGAYIALVDGERREAGARGGPRGARAGLQDAAVGAGRLAAASPTWRCSAWSARSTASSTSASRRPSSTPSRSSPAWWTTACRCCRRSSAG